MVKGLRGAVKSNGYDHYITQRWGCPDLLHIYIYDVGPDLSRNATCS